MNKLNVEDYLRELIIKNDQLGFYSFNTLCAEEKKAEISCLTELSELYENKLITYPRVINEKDCEVPLYYHNKKEEYIEYILKHFEIGEFEKLINKNKNQKYFKANMRDFHHGIICVGFKNEIKELGIYEKIMLRYLFQFIPTRLEYVKIKKIRNF